MINPMRILLIFSLLLLSGFSLSTGYALESYQGRELEVRDGLCGAPMVQALRASDGRHLLNDSNGLLGLKASLEKISASNLARWRKALGALSAKEQSLIIALKTKFLVPLVHRTTLPTAQTLLMGHLPMSSPAKRGVVARITADVEDQIFGGHDCIFASAAPPYGIVPYGTVIMRIKNNEGFAWGSVYTGYTWVREILKRSPALPATDPMKRDFAEFVVSNNHFQEALAFQIIHYTREGGSIRSLGASYDKNAILDTLLASPSNESFWGAVVHYRLAFLEAHYVDDIPMDDMQFVQFREADRALVALFNLPDSWFKGPSPRIQFFSRSE